MMNATVTLDSVYLNIENINQIVKERRRKTSPSIVNNLKLPVANDFWVGIDFYNNSSLVTSTPPLRP